MESICIMNNIQVLSMLFRKKCSHWLPFLGKGKDFLVLDTKDIVDGPIGETVLEVETIGASLRNL